MTPSSISNRSSASPSTTDAQRADWRTDIPEPRRRFIRAWLWSIAAMTLAVLIVGGITRLTLSGLSIVEWRPFTGIIPPLTEAQWQRMFDLYRQYPEYQQSWRTGMTLADFKFIFFWEYLHRLLARTIGLVFLVPFVFFWAKGWFNRPLTRRALLLFALGASQGLMGWLMVASGLVDMPRVSHYRLAAHLSLAFMIFGYAVWLARDLKLTTTRTMTSASARRIMLRGLAVVGGLLVLQIVWGAFVAGLRAGKLYNTFPLMGGQLVPPNVLQLEPAWRNFIEYAVTVQWLYRLIGTALGAAALAVFIKVSRANADAVSQRYNGALVTLILAQYGLGIATLLLFVPVALGVIHQATAMIIFGVWLIWLHHVRNLGETL
jgi:cytochrome c oxidase assembly protein subunit 15